MHMYVYLYIYFNDFLLFVLFPTQFHMCMCVVLMPSVRNCHVNLTVLRMKEKH